MLAERSFLQKQAHLCIELAKLLTFVDPSGPQTDEGDPFGAFDFEPIALMCF